MISLFLVLYWMAMNWKLTHIVTEESQWMDRHSNLNRGQFFALEGRQCVGAKSCIIILCKLSGWNNFHLAPVKIISHSNWGWRIHALRINEGNTFRRIHTGYLCKSCSNTLSPFKIDNSPRFEFVSAVLFVGRYFGCRKHHSISILMLNYQLNTLGIARTRWEWVSTRLRSIPFPALPESLLLLDSLLSIWSACHMTFPHSQVLWIMRYSVFFLAALRTRTWKFGPALPNITTESRKWESFKLWNGSLFSQLLSQRFFFDLYTKILVLT